MAYVAAQLGHTDTRMTEKHYGHLAPTALADAIRTLAPELGLGNAPLDFDLILGMLRRVTNLTDAGLRMSYRPSSVPTSIIIWPRQRWCLAQPAA